MYGRDNLYQVAYECFYVDVMKSTSNLSACDTDIIAASEFLWDVFSTAVRSRGVIIFVTSRYECNIDVIKSMSNLSACGTSGSRVIASVFFRDVFSSLSICIYPERVYSIDR